MDIPQGGSSCSCFKADLEFRMLVFVEGGKLEDLEKNPLSKNENP